MAFTGKSPCHPVYGRAIDFVKRGFPVWLFGFPGRRDVFAGSGFTRKSIGTDINTTFMKTDVYTKIVLTVIAVCLVVIVFKNIDLVPAARAIPAAPAVPQSKEVVDVRIVGVGYNVELPVKLQSMSNRSLPVKIEDVDFMCRPLPVEVKK